MKEMDIIIVIIGLILIFAPKLLWGVRDESNKKVNPHESSVKTAQILGIIVLIIIFLGIIFGF